mgnify:CR=1 FL=1
MSDIRLRLYLETTTFNYFFDDRKGHYDVVRLFEAIKAGRFAGYTSQYVMDELKKAPEPKQTNMVNLINTHGIITLNGNPEAEALARKYREKGIIPHSQKMDSRHIAVASLYKLDTIVSYNFHHINRDKTKKLIPIVNATQNLRGINFWTAREVFEYDRLRAGASGDGSY